MAGAGQQLLTLSCTELKLRQSLQHSGVLTALLLHSQGSCLTSLLHSRGCAGSLSSEGKDESSGKTANHQGWSQQGTDLC